MVKPTVISTFAGCGGSSLGYQWAGFNELLAIEWDNNAVETFKANFPDIPVYHGDVHDLTVQECMEQAGIEERELSVLDGSPPCQGFSTAGNRKMNDPRNSLFGEFARLLDGLQPAVFIMENVTGLIRGHMKQIYLQIMETLRECGYKVEGEILNAKYFNVPQNRRRVIVIGVRNDFGIEPSHPKPQSKPQTVQRLDSKPGKYSYKRWGDKIVTERHTARTIDKMCRFFWNKHEQWGIQSYIYAASFPSAFLWEGNEADIKRRIGNSVPPKLMQAIAEHVKIEILKRQNNDR